MPKESLPQTQIPFLYTMQKGAMYGKANFIYRPRLYPYSLYFREGY